MQVVLRLCRNFDLLFFTLDILKNALLDRLIQERHRHLAGKQCRRHLIMFNRVCMRPSIATCTTRIALGIPGTMAVIPFFSYLLATRVANVRPIYPSVTYARISRVIPLFERGPRYCSRRLSCQSDL